MNEDRAFAASFFNAVWKLLDKSPRSAAEDMQMIHLAHASRAHWQVAGGPREWSIGEWQIARVYAALGRGEPALVHARLRWTWPGRRIWAPSFWAAGMK